MLARGYQGNNIFVAAAVAMASAAVLMTALGRVRSMAQCGQRPGRPTVVVGPSASMNKVRRHRVEPWSIQN